ncbi:DUF3379 family protein [Halomonas denitrificans]|nr:DUF3379 domain-containing protein [Halomonas denitrificans]
MNVDELRRQLMTDPQRHRDEAETARETGGDAGRVAAESEAFERLLDEALNVAPPEDLETRLRQTAFRAGRSRDGRSGRRSVSGPARWLALAATVTLAVAITVFTLRETPTDGGSQLTAPELGAFIARHWDYDGTEVLAAALTDPTDASRVQALLDGFGVRLEPELLADVRLSKICPTPDGAGAHLILATGDGPLTLYYMPQTRVPGSGERYPLADGMQAWVFNVERGSIALVGEDDRDLPLLGRRISDRLVFPEERRL